jgi:hypothetical protein
MAPLTVSLPAHDDVEAPEPEVRLLRDLRATPQGLSSREADRRKVNYGQRAVSPRRPGMGLRSWRVS